ncbi:MAG: sodium:solute symporter [Bacteroidetes bacterium]|nr:MAG: sodium:solute symporter [Bacteroidota bacterium]
MTPALVLVVLFLYFAMLVVIAFITGRNVNNEGFFLANKKVPWYIVSYGMIGVSISGVTFISVPGTVGLETGLNRGFGYMQVVLGYLLGYLFIATVLMPLYYRLNLTSIYGYLERRLGFWSYKTGAGFFILSRTFGSATRMFLATVVLHSFVFQHFGIPYLISVLIMMSLIYAYTFKGGLKTIIWTDMIMTTFFLVAVVWTVITVAGTLNLSIDTFWPAIQKSGYGQIFFFDNFFSDPNHFVKQFVSGALIAIVMTGMDQDLMQKNLACKNIREAQKNMFVFCIYLVLTNIAFLLLGALLYMYAGNLGIAIPERTDYLYPKIAFEHLGTIAGIFFILGLIASAYSSSDSALTALTTSFCVDFLDFEKNKQHPDPYAPEQEKLAHAELTETQQRRARTIVHLSFAVVFILIILGLYYFSQGAVISLIFKIAGYTYGPLLGLFTFGMFTRLKLHPWVLRIPRRKGRYWEIPAVTMLCILAPMLTWLIEVNCRQWFDIGFLTILVNGLLTFAGLWIMSYREDSETAEY